MKRVAVVLAAVLSFVPAVLGVWGNESFSEDVPVVLPASSVQIVAETEDLAERGPQRRTGARERRRGRRLGRIRWLGVLGQVRRRRGAGQAERDGGRVP